MEGKAERTGPEEQWALGSVLLGGLLGGGGAHSKLSTGGAKKQRSQSISCCVFGVEVAPSTVHSMTFTL